MKKLKSKGIYFNGGLLCLIFPIFLFSQCKSTYTNVWIDKDESENYEPRHECSFVQAGDKFIMFGGRESAKELEVYDYKNDSWSKGGEAPKEFNHFQATFYNGFIWVIGSFKTNSFPKEVPEENIWLYHHPTKKWIKGPEIPEDRRRGGAGLVVYKDVFYLVGGNTIGHDGGYVKWFDSYDPKTNTWTVLPDASEARDHFFAGIIDNTLYAAGGRKSGGEGGVFAPVIGVVDTYDFDTKTWSVLKDELPTPRAAPSVAAFHGELLVMGGEGEKTGPAYKTVEAYNPATQTWTRKADMHYARHGTQAILSGEGIYIAGGSPERGGGRQLNMEVYNEDAPQGLAIVSSNLIAPEKVMVTSGTKQIVILENKGGNSGSFINSVTLAGAESDNFKIASDFNLRLVDADGKVEIEVEHLGSAKGETADLKITYNGDIEKDIRLVSE